MGRRARERRQRIEAGLEKPISQRKPGDKMLRCPRCKVNVPESQARQHMKECWGVDLPEEGPVPIGQTRRRLRDGLVLVRKDQDREEHASGVEPP
jgi:hypothetical protein